MRDVFTLDVILKSSGKQIKKSPQVVDVSLIQQVVQSSEESMRISVNVDATSATVNVPFKFQILHTDVPEPSLIRCKVVDATGTLVEIVLHPQSGKGVIDVLLTPLVATPHVISLTYDGSPVSGKSEFKVNPEPYAAVIGEQDRDDGVVGEDYPVQVESINVKIFDLKVAVKGPNPQGGPPIVVASLLDSEKDQGITTSFKPQRGQLANPNGVENGIFDLSFKPKIAGSYSVLIYLHKKPLAIHFPVTINCNTVKTVATGKQSTVLLASDLDQNPNFSSPRANAGSPNASSPRTATTGPVQVTASAKTPVQIQAKSTGPVQISASNTSQVSPQADNPDTVKKSHSSHKTRTKDGVEREKSHGDKQRSHRSRDKK